jgi:lantibiotic modifying enzyme
MNYINAKKTNKLIDFKNEIIFMTKTLSTMVDKIQPSLGLMRGKMGYSIFFYHASKFTNNEQYINVADRLLDSVCKGVNERYTSDIVNGLAGIGLGIDYLIKQKYIDGNINDVLEKIDIPIFKTISFQENKLPLDFRLKIQLLYYCCIRLKDQKT